MKRRISLLLMLSLISLTACGKNAEADTTSKEPAIVKETLILRHQEDTPVEKEAEEETPVSEEEPAEEVAEKELIEEPVVSERIDIEDDVAGGAYGGYSRKMVEAFLSVTHPSIYEAIKDLSNEDFVKALDEQFESSVMGVFGTEEPKTIYIPNLSEEQMTRRRNFEMFVFLYENSAFLNYSNQANHFFEGTFLPDGYDYESKAFYNVYFNGFFFDEDAIFEEEPSFDIDVNGESCKLYVKMEKCPDHDDCPDISDYHMIAIVKTPKEYEPKIKYIGSSNYVACETDTFPNKTETYVSTKARIRICRTDEFKENISLKDFKLRLIPYKEVPYPETEDAYTYDYDYDNAVEINLADVLE